MYQPCVICGCHFRPKGHRIKCCSSPCSAENQRRINRRTNAEWREKNRDLERQRMKEYNALKRRHRNFLDLRGGWDTYRGQLPATLVRAVDP